MYKGAKVSWRTHEISRDLDVTGTKALSLSVVYLLRAWLIMAFSLQYWVTYTQNCTKLQRKSEQSVAGDRVLSFNYDASENVALAHVQASMRDKSYKVQVSDLTTSQLSFVLFIIFPSIRTQLSSIVS